MVREEVFKRFGIGDFFEAELMEAEGPDVCLVVDGFVEVGWHFPGMGEEGAFFVGALHAEALGGADDEGFEVAAFGVGEEEFGVWV